MWGKIKFKKKIMSRIGVNLFNFILLRACSETPWVLGCFSWKMGHFFLGYCILKP